MRLIHEGLVMPEASAQSQKTREIEAAGFLKFPSFADRIQTPQKTP
jgi:hypothetical protein